jgi:hypothetical protein
MALIRGFETAAARYLAAGAIGGCVHLSLGREAVAAGICLALRDDDQITTPTQRLLETATHGPARAPRLVPHEQRHPDRERLPAARGEGQPARGE